METRVLPVDYTFKLLIGVAIGIAVGYAEPQLAISLKPIGDAFIKAIKLMVAPMSS